MSPIKVLYLSEEFTLINTAILSDYVDTAVLLGNDGRFITAPLKKITAISPLMPEKVNVDQDVLSVIAGIVNKAIMYSDVATIPLAEFRRLKTLVDDHILRK